MHFFDNNYSSIRKFILFVLNLLKDHFDIFILIMLIIMIPFQISRWAVLLPVFKKLVYSTLYWTL